MVEKKYIAARLFKSYPRTGRFTPCEERVISALWMFSFNSKEVQAFIDYFYGVKLRASIISKYKNADLKILKNTRARR